MSPYAELDHARVEVSPGGEATTTLTVRNNTDIVEAYEFEVVGECASWVTVEPIRLSLYPGTHEAVTLVLRPPHSSEVPAGEAALAVRVVPVERPELVLVPEMTVVIAAFRRIRASLMPQRRRAWRSGRYQVALHNQGNTPIVAPLSATDPAEHMHYRFDSAQPSLEPGEQAEIRLRAKMGSFVWFGKPSSNPFLVTASVAGRETEGDPQPTEEVEGELVQLPLLPRWLLTLLALLLALLLAWFTLARPLVQTAAREAAEQQAEQMVEEGRLTPPAEAEQPEPEPPEQDGQPPGAADPRVGDLAVNGGQHSETIEVRTNPGGTGSRSYTVPEDKIFFITDLVLANYQGDEGVLTIDSHDRRITTIALESFRNQDYHWVTPIPTPANTEIKATVRCTRPGTPPSGQQAAQCVELLNVTGVLRDAPR